MKRIVLFLLCAVFVITAFSGCTGTGELRKVKLNEVTRSVFYAPLYVAVSRGFFKAEGIELTIETGGGSDKSMTALLANEAEIALMGPETGVYVVNEGKEEHPIIIGQLTKRDGSFLMGREADSAFNWEKLRGKTVIAGRPGGMPYMTLMYVLKQHGIIPDVDVEIISNIQFSLMGGAFEGGTGDYVTLFEPTASMFQSAGKGHIVANVGLESGEVPYTTFMVRKSTIENDKDLVSAFIRAIYKAQQWVKTAKNNDIAIAMQPFFPDTDIATLESVAKSYRETDSWMQTPVMTESAFARLQDIIDGAGELKARVNFKDLVDNSFAEEAVKNG